MRKADSLRQWLTAALPDLKTHPDRLSIFVETGQINARQSRSLSFSYGYTLKVGIWDFAGDADHIIVPLLAWIEREQPDLLRQNDSQAFDFEAELLDGYTSDIVISIRLTEGRVVQLSASGDGYHVERPAEPDLSDQFAGVTAKFRHGFAKMESMVISSDPEAIITPGIPPSP